MKRRVSGSRVRQGRQSSTQLANRTRSVLVALFAVIAAVLITRLLLRQTDASWISAIGTALIIVLPLSLLMLASQILFFLISLALFGAILLDSGGFPLTYTGMVLWVMGGVAAFVLTLSYFARHIAPPFNVDLNRTSYLGFVLLLQQALRDILGGVTPDQHVVQNIAYSFNTLNAGEVPHFQTYAIHNGQRYSNAAGPGYTLLSEDTHIISAIDLRPQVRQQAVQVATRDGIQIETKLRVEFGVASPEQATPTRLPYPFRRSAIRELIYGSTVETDGGEHTIHPFEQILQRGVLLLTEEISRSSLDGLLQVNQFEATPLDDVHMRLKERLEAFARKKGLEIIALELAPLQLPADVQSARLSAWKKSWKAPIDNRGLGKSIGRISADQARAQLQVVEDLLQNLDTFADADAEIGMRDEIIEQVRDVIRDAAAEGLLKSLIPDPK